MPARLPRLPVEEEPVRIAIALPSDTIARIDEIGKRLATGSRGRTIQVVVDTIIGMRPHLANARQQAEQFAQASEKQDEAAQGATFIGVVMSLGYITNELKRLVGEGSQSGT